MRVLVASDFEPGSHRAHAINVVKTAGGLLRCGHAVTVVCRAPQGGGSAAAAASDYREPGLQWRTVAIGADGARAGPARERAFARAVHELLPAFDLVYARHFRAGLAAAHAGVPAAIETHAWVGDPNPALQAAIDATRGPLRCLLTISAVLRDDYVARGGDPARIRVVADGVDVAQFAPTDGIGVCPFVRWSELGHAVYAGHLYDYKGIPTVLDAAARRPRVGFELVGGAPEDVAATRARAADLPNVRVHGQVPYAEVPPWLWHADALLLPPSAREPSARWTSPVKLGEYLASTRPIVAAAIPGLQAWVDAPLVQWFAPDDAVDMGRAIGAAFGERGIARRQRVLLAQAAAHRFDYANRAAAIVTGVGLPSTAAVDAADLG